MGYFKYKDWKYDYSLKLSFDKGNIKILYRDKIKVFYSSV